MAKGSNNVNKHGAVKLPCCSVELSWLQVFSLLGIFINTFFFTALLILLIVTQTYQGNTNFELLNLRSEVYLNQGKIDSALVTAALTNNTMFLKNIDKYFTSLNEATESIFASAPTTIYNRSEVDSLYDSFNTTSKAIAKLIEEGNSLQAASMLASPQVINLRELFNSILENLLTYVVNNQLQNSETTSALIATSLTFISFTLITNLPLIIFILSFTIISDTKNVKNQKMVETMALKDNPKLRKLFRNHCEKDHSVELLDFLEDVTEYRTICLAEESADSVQFDNSETIELKKYKKAKAIHKEYLEVSGSKAINVSKLWCDQIAEILQQFENERISELDSTTFQSLENEVKVVMLDSFYRFRSSCIESKKTTKKLISFNSSHDFVV